MSTKLKTFAMHSSLVWLVVQNYVVSQYFYNEALELGWLYQHTDCIKLKPYIIELTYKSENHNRWGRYKLFKDISCIVHEAFELIAQRYMVFMWKQALIMKYKAPPLELYIKK